MHASNDKIYGTTNNGGLYGYGGIFEYDYNNGVYTKKHDFIYSDGNQGMPGGMIMEASNGKIYGMRNGGGFYGLGTFYEFDIATDSFVVKLHFNDTLGAEPLGGLVQASNGKLYAGINGGGSSAQGLIIEYDINTDSVIMKKDFNGTGVSAYNGTFIEVAPNKLYALSIIGGQNNEGALYEFDCITNQIAILYSFSAPTGYDPVGSLVYASNGKLYGSTKSRNVYDIGGLFEFDLATGAYNHKLDWEPIETGWRPGFKLQEVGCIAPGILASGPVSFCQGDSVILSAFGSNSNSFQWHRNGNPIAGANSQNFTVKLPGKYSVSVTDTTCSLLFTSNPVRVRIPCIPPFDNQDKLSSTSTDADIFLNYDSQQQQFEIMATDLTSETYNLLIADATGRILLNEQSGISNNSISRNIDCSAFAKGLYIVKVIAGDKILSRKFVKER
ncbi:MAG: T9SS type A sorting domain-containing protein [Bacteroidetes bacterium]|nr:T9SS type A sorting domain-containing protein [Bacteroidota bacterium]